MSQTSVDTKGFDDSNWRQEYKGHTSNTLQQEILDNGPHSLAQSWMMQAMHNHWMRIKGYSYPQPPNCQSSFMEFEKSIEKIQEETEV